MREKVKKLWKLCFNDNDEFVDMYFNLRYNSEVNVAIESGDEVIAALQMLPYPITFHGNSVPTAYISGACTHCQSSCTIYCMFLNTMLCIYDFN